MRAGAGRGAGESMRGPGNREDLPTLRVTNISEDTLENDLRELFGVFGRVARVYVGRDRETGAGKGFAFVSFEERAVAQKALERVNGKGYDNLILSVQWSRKNLFFELLYAGFDSFVSRATARGKIRSVANTRASIVLLVSLKSNYFRNIITRAAFFWPCVVGLHGKRALRESECQAESEYQPGVQSESDLPDQRA